MPDTEGIARMPAGAEGTQEGISKGGHGDDRDQRAQDLLAV